MSGVLIHTLWASMPEDVAPWMIAAEDEASWEGDPDRCDRVFREAKEKADKNGWQTREITIRVDWPQLDAAFLPPEITGSVLITSPTEEAS